MAFVPGGTFRMGSDRHYAEEAPVRRVTVSGFWMDCTPVTNRDFRKFINATGIGADPMGRAHSRRCRNPLASTGRP